MLLFLIFSLIVPNASFLEFLILLFIFLRLLSIASNDLETLFNSEIDISDLIDFAKLLHLSLALSIWLLRDLTLFTTPFIFSELNSFLVLLISACVLFNKVSTFLISFASATAEVFLFGVLDDLEVDVLPALLLVFILILYLPLSILLRLVLIFSNVSLTLSN